MFILVGLPLNFRMVAIDFNYFAFASSNECGFYDKNDAGGKIKSNFQINFENYKLQKKE